jgi:hypothetical protein
MKTKILSITTIVLLAFTISSCTKTQGCMQVTANNYDSNAEEDDGSCIFDGKVTFWKDEADGLDIIVVVMNDGTSGNISTDLTSQPNCDASGCFTFTAPPGDYSYVATEAGTGATWSNSLTITSNGCQTRKLN